MPTKQNSLARIKNIGLIAQSNASVAAAFVFAFCLAMLIFTFARYEVEITAPYYHEGLMTQADFFLGSANWRMFGMCFAPLSVIFMLYCTKNDYLSPRMVRFRHIESFWFLQAAKALLAALLFALAITLALYFFSLAFAGGDVNFDSPDSVFFYKAGRRIIVPSPSLSYVIFVFFCYSFLTLLLANLIWLLLDAIFSKRWFAVAASVAIGAINALLPITVPLVFTLANITYPQWVAGNISESYGSFASFGFYYLIAAIVAVAVAGALFYRVRGCPRAVY